MFALPSNLAAVRGDNQVYANGNGTFDVFTPSEGWWGFSMTLDQAIRAAEIMPMTTMPRSK